MEDVKKDVVNHPEHYNNGPCECIDAIKHALTPEEFRGYCKGAAFKYLWRHKYKGNPEQDIQKALWYLKKHEEEFIKDV